MPYSPQTNFNDSNGVDLGDKLVTKDYLLSVYGTIVDSNIITTTPQLWGWGRNIFGELGVNDTNSRTTPVTTILGGTDWLRVISCERNTAAIKTNGTLWIWGSNGYGTLGINSRNNRNTPVTTILGGTNWKLVSCGRNHTASIKTDGTLWTWGRNANGQLGINNTNDRSIPVTTILGGTNWKLVSCGFNHIASIKTDGTLWVWGQNANGQLGINNTNDRSIPVTTILGGTNWKSVSSTDHTAAIKTDGTLWTWGFNNSGQLGINNTSDKSTPVTTILGGTDWKSVSCGTDHTAAIKTDGSLWTWGRNNSGQLGVNDTTQRLTPVTTILGGTNFKLIYCGAQCTITIKTDGTLWTWGSNAYGQLGVNDTNNRNTPITTILGGSNWKSVSNSYHVSAILSNDII